MFFLTYISLIFKLEYSVCAIASHPVSVISLPTFRLFHSKSRYFQYRKSSIKPPLSNKPPPSNLPLIKLITPPPLPYLFFTN